MRFRGRFGDGVIKRWGVVLCALTLGCGDKEAKQPMASFSELPKLPADQVIIGFEQYMTQAGIKKAVLFGDTAYLFEDSAMAKVKGIKMTLFDEKGKESARVTARAGDVFTNTQRMNARGNVVLTTTEGRRIESEEMNYDPNSHRIWSTKATTQRFQGGTLAGTSFDADDKFVNVRIVGARSRGGGFKITF